MKNDVELITQKLQGVFKEVKRKYKNKSPLIIFIIQNQGTHEYIGYVNMDIGESSGTYKKYGLLENLKDKLFGGKINFKLALKLDKDVKKMKDLTPLVEYNLSQK
jgi:hypothetical protein